MTHQENGRLGVWIIGARGGLATTIMAGHAMLARGLVEPVGLLTESDPFNKLPFTGMGRLVFGGHDLRQGSVYESALQIQRETGTLDHERLLQIEDDLQQINEDILIGTSFGCGATIRALGSRTSNAAPETGAAFVKRFQADIKAFQKQHKLDRVVLVNVASTEPPLELAPEHLKLPAFRRLLKQSAKESRRLLRASMLYGYGAADLGVPIINFTPNTGMLIPAVQALAIKRDAPFMGNDGKTGETLVKSALAPMFRYRNLRVLSWQGYNILGDQDGQVLADPENKRSKVATKDGLLENILGYPLHTHVGIDYVPSLKDLKTAWDFVHFEGFLNFKMSLQFTWQGCDAVLAAPLILDMVRFADLAAREGDQGGSMPWLSCFFKAPVGVQEHDLHNQFHLLMDYVEGRIS